MVGLGLCYARGWDIRQDYKKAVEWYTKAAEQAHACAQFGLGQFYSNGSDGVMRDYKQATECYTKSAEQGHADAQNSLGDCYYYYGHGVTQDYKQATEWYTNLQHQNRVHCRSYETERKRAIARY